MRSPRLLLLLLVPLGLVGAFQAPVSFHRTRSRTSSLSMALQPTELLPLTDTIATATGTPASTSILLAEESWRQYVPLIVSALVIVYILLGSPAANSILGLVRASEQQDDDQDAESPRVIQTKGERIDSGEVANEALEKARNALDWQVYKEETKRDEDRMEDLRKKMDQQMRDFDNK